MTLIYFFQILPFLLKNFHLDEDLFIDDFLNSNIFIIYHFYLKKNFYFYFLFLKKKKFLKFFFES